MNAETKEDAVIIESVLSGNLDDFRKLVEEYQYVAERWAFQHVRNLDEAESIAQEAFVEAYFRLDTLRDPGKFGNWLHSIVNNTAVSRLRQYRRLVSFEEIHTVQHSGELAELYNRYETPTPIDVLERREQESQIQMAINSLPPTQKRIIDLFYFDSCSYKEIAACLNTSVASVKSMLHRARERLRKEMLKNV